MASRRLYPSISRVGHRKPPKRTLTEKDISCPVCREKIRTPVTLPCSHCFCKACLEQSWKQSPTCPVCRRRNSMADLLVIEGVQPGKEPEKPEELCGVHGEKLRLFCLKDRTPICLVCQTAKNHKGHDCCPIEEAVEDRKEELTSALKPLKEKLKDYNKAKQIHQETLKHIKSQVQYTENQIKQQFRRLHLFLRDEEIIRIATLRKEEEKKSKLLINKIETMTKWIQSLSDTIGGVEQEMEAPRVSFLHHYEATMKSTKCTVEDPESLSEGELINTAKHLGSLNYRVWEKMQGICQYTPVTLDPNTAMPNLLLSEDLSRVSLAGDNQQLPDNPERFRHHSIVLGSEGFTAGRHTWDIEVGDNTHWVLGVAKESVRRKEEAAALSSRHGLWAICQIKGEYSALASPTTPLSVKWKPRTIRVTLDWDKGKVTFSDPIYDEHIHTYRHKFTEKLFPYFLTLCKLYHLQILPQKVSVKVV